MNLISFNEKPLFEAMKEFFNEWDSGLTRFRQPIFASGAPKG